jgi:purine-binding chemotaxis protein CheW
METTKRTKLGKILDSDSGGTIREVQAAPAPMREFLCFLLGEENYGVEAFQVNEIIPNQAINPVPCTPDWILGAIYFRGQILPIVDLKNLLGLPGSQSSPQSRILIVQSQDISAGIKADQVYELTQIPADKIQAPLTVLEKIKSDYLLGEVLLNDRLIILLNLDKIIEGARIQRRKTS